MLRKPKEEAMASEFKNSKFLQEHYYLLNSHYKSDNLDKGRKFKNFFDKLCQHIFDINLTMLEGIEDFPLLYSEKKSYSSIAAAINAITPYHTSEWTIDCRGYGIADKESGKEKKTRAVDFWCRSKDKDFDVWIEAKALRFYVSKDELDTDYIQKAFEQILEIHKIDRQDGIQSHKLVLLNTKVICDTKDFFDESYQKSLEKVPQIFAKKLDEEYGKIDDEITKEAQKGLLLGVLDLRELIQKDIENDLCYRVDYSNGLENKSFFGKRVAPYIILAGLVITNPRD